MKSIVEEASSISKAIHNGWLKAGKPAEFSVKIFEEPEKGFLGLFTKKAAKIGIFFKEPVEAPMERTRRQPRQEFRTRQGRPEVAQPVRVQNQQQQPRQPQQPRESRVTWTPDMVHEVRRWLDTNIQIINGGAIPHAVNAQNNVLTVRFETNILQDKRKEAVFLKNSAQLVMQALQLKFKKQAFGLKINLLGA